MNPRKLQKLRVHARATKLLVAQRSLLSNMQILDVIDDEYERHLCVHTCIHIYNLKKKGIHVYLQKR